MLVSNGFHRDSQNDECEYWRRYGRRHRSIRKLTQKQCERWREAMLNRWPGPPSRDPPRDFELSFTTGGLTPSMKKELAKRKHDDSKIIEIYYPYSISFVESAPGSYRRFVFKECRYGEENKHLNACTVRNRCFVAYTLNFKITTLPKSLIPRGALIRGDPTGFLCPWMKRIGRFWVPVRKPTREEIIFVPHGKGKNYEELPPAGWDWCPTANEQRIARLCRYDEDAVSYVWEKMATARPGPRSRSPYEPVPNFRVKQWFSQWLRDRKKSPRTVSIHGAMGADSEDNSDTDALRIYWLLEKEVLGHHEAKSIFYQGDPQNGEGNREQGSRSRHERVNYNSKRMDTWEEIRRHSLRVAGALERAGFAYVEIQMSEGRVQPIGHFVAPSGAERPLFPAGGEWSIMPARPRIVSSCEPFHEHRWESSDLWIHFRGLEKLRLTGRDYWGRDALGLVQSSEESPYHLAQDFCFDGKERSWTEYAAWAWVWQSRGYKKADTPWKRPDQQFVDREKLEKKIERYEEIMIDDRGRRNTKERKKLEKYFGTLGGISHT
jgi:hypothetical protein